MGLEVPDREDRRRRLRLLDSCLNILEDANERHQTRVTAEMAMRLAGVTRIRPGMLIREAMDQVLREQESCLWPVPDARRMAVTGDASALSRAEARDLTARIRSAAGQMCLLLLEAYERRAARALGYPTWQAYARDEFGLSRSRSYELLDQARAILTLREAAGMSGNPDISAQAARDIKSRLDDVVEAVRERARTVAPERRAALVKAVVDQHRTRPDRAVAVAADEAGALAGVTVAHTGGTAPAELARIRQVVVALGGLPSPREVVAGIPDSQLADWRGIGTARRWLSELEALLDQRWSQVATAASR